MAKRLPTIERDDRESTYPVEQKSFVDGIWGDVPAVAVPPKGLNGGENVFITDQGFARGRPGTHHLTAALSGDPLALGFISKAADGNSYWIAKIGTSLYYSTHHPTTPAYFLTWTLIKNKTHYQTNPVFYGSGLNDMKQRGINTCAASKGFSITIDRVSSPNTFCWVSEDSQVWEGEHISITGAKQTLKEGVKILFGSTTGHTLNDQWAFNAAAPIGLLLKANERSTIREYGEKALLFDGNGLFLIYYDTADAALRSIKLNTDIAATLAPVLSGSGYNNFIRYYAYTLAMVVGDEIVHESNPWWYTLNGERLIYRTAGNATEIGLNPITLTNLPTKTQIGNTIAGAHFNSIILYSTVNLTFEGNIPSPYPTNSADPTIMARNQIIPIESGEDNATTATDNVLDIVLQSQMKAGLILKNRLLRPVVNSNIGAIAGTFVFTWNAILGLSEFFSTNSPGEQYMGYSHKNQWVRPNSRVNAIEFSGNKALFLSDGRTAALNTSSYSMEDESASPVPLFDKPDDVSLTLGVPAENIGTIAHIDEEKLCAMTNEGIRVFDGFGWTPTSSGMDLHKYGLILKNCPAGAVAAYGNGKYYLWFRSNKSQSAYNDLCVVLDFTQKKSYPMTKIAGIATTGAGISFPMPGLYVGALAVFYQGKTLVCCYRRQYGTTFADRRIYWIDTFDSTANAIFVKETVDNYYEDTTPRTAAIATFILMRGWAGPTESHKLVPRRIYLFWSKDPDETAFLTGFVANLDMYLDDVFKETMSNVKTASTEVKEIGPAFAAECNTFQLKLSTNTTGFLFRGYLIDFDLRLEAANIDTERPDAMAIRRALGSGVEAQVRTWEVYGLTGAVDSYTAGGLRELWAGGYFSFFYTQEPITSQALFGLVTDPAGISDGAIKVTRYVTSSNPCGFRKTFSTAFTLSTAFSISIWGITNDTNLEDLLTFSPSTAMTTFLKLQISTTQLKIIDSDGNYKTYDGTFEDWVHIAVTFTSGTWAVYIDGTKTTATASSGTIAAPASCLVMTIANTSRMGKYLSFFNPRHYAKTLTDAQVDFLYKDITANQGKATLLMR